MRKQKIKVGILFGGKSAEHEVSLQSAKNVVDAIDREKYEVVLIGIDKTGKWFLIDTPQFLINENDPKHIALNKENAKIVTLLPSGGGLFINASDPNDSLKIDVAFPILHGPFGEDGTVQGFLKLAGVPFVGAGVAGSAVGMDKDIMKRLLRDAKIPIGKFLVFKDGEKIDFTRIVEVLGLPFFIKPANLGSSVGVSKVKDEMTFDAAIREAFKYDTKIVIEEFIEGREIECAVLGNDKPIASGLGEIIPNQEFYSYDAKYLDPEGASLEIPAQVSEQVAEKISKYAIDTFKALSCEGLGRVDLFLKKDGSLFVNEINTIPGFTKISMYPKLWDLAGVSYPNLIDRLIMLALERFEKEQELLINK